jgi:DNA-binding transcriptional regulator YiaG
MSDLFSDLKTSLEDAVEFEKGSKKSGTRVRTVATLNVKEPKEWSPRKIQRLRRELILTQSLFAALLGVGPDAVKAWEQGRATPMRSTLRLLDLFLAHRDLVDDVIELKRGA